MESKFRRYYAGLDPFAMSYGHMVGLANRIGLFERPTQGRGYVDAMTDSADPATAGTWD